MPHVWPIIFSGQSNRARDLAFQELQEFICGPAEDGAEEFGEGMCPKVSISSAKYVSSPWKKKRLTVHNLKVPKGQRAIATGRTEEEGYKNLIGYCVTNQIWGDVMINRLLLLLLLHYS